MGQEELWVLIIFGRIYVIKNVSLKSGYLQFVGSIKKWNSGKLDQIFCFFFSKKKKKKKIKKIQ